MGRRAGDGEAAGRGIVTVGRSLGWRRRTSWRSWARPWATSPRAGPQPDPGGCRSARRAWSAPACRWLGPVTELEVVLLGLVDRHPAPAPGSAHRPHRRPSPAVRRLLGRPARTPWPSPPTRPSHRPTRRAAAAGRAADDRGGAARWSAWRWPTCRTTAGALCPAVPGRPPAADAAVDDLQDRFGTGSVTRATPPGDAGPIPRPTDGAGGRKRYARRVAGGPGPWWPPAGPARLPAMTGEGVHPRIGTAADRADRQATTPCTPATSGRCAEKYSARAVAIQHEPAFTPYADRRLRGVQALSALSPHLVRGQGPAAPAVSQWRRRRLLERRQIELRHAEHGFGGTTPVRGRDR